jgi:hypothetical protein
VLIKLLLLLFEVCLSFGHIGVGQFNLFVQLRELLVALNELRAKDITLVPHHIIIFLLLNLLVFGLLDEFLEMPHMDFLIADDLLSGGYLQLGLSLVGLDFNIFVLYLFELFVQLYQLLILAFYL